MQRKVLYFRVKDPKYFFFLLSFFLSWDNHMLFIKHMLFKDTHHTIYFTRREFKEEDNKEEEEEEEDKG